MTNTLPTSSETAYFALGCFWGAERLFWETPGVIDTKVGYQGGETLDPTYEEVCSGTTGHAETVKVVFDPQIVTYEKLLKIFFQEHDPTQLNRQGNDIGTQYRSALFVDSEQQYVVAHKVFEAYSSDLQNNGFSEAVTKIEYAKDHPFYLAEEYHQRYLEKNPNGYCGLKGTGVICQLSGL